MRFLAAVLLLLAPAVPAQELILCGWDTISILSIVDGRPASEPAFRWTAPGNPEFRTTDECKPLPHGRILVTSSGNGVALLDRASSQATLFAPVPNAHSAELLPGNRIVVAASTHKNGNRLVVFDPANPLHPLSSTELESAHGVVWDPQRNRLWALGLTALRAYRWNDPTLALDSEFPLPTRGGHDLVAIDNSPHLALTTEFGVYLFHRDDRKFSPHPDLPDAHDVKSLSIQPRTGQLVYVQADSPNWWSSTLRFLHPAQSVTLSQRLYKARWVR
jgi:hypothetical protein